VLRIRIRIRSDRQHFEGSGSESRACRTQSGAGSIATKCKAKLYCFPENFKILSKKYENYETYDADEKVKNDED